MADNEAQKLTEAVDDAIQTLSSVETSDDSDKPIDRVVWDVRAKPGGSEHDGDLRRFILGKLKAAGEKVRIIHDSHSFFGIIFEVANGTMSPLETLDQEVLEDIQVREVVQHK